MSSDLERYFETQWKALGGPDLKQEYRFHPTRRWRFDFAEPKMLIAIELEGGVWVNGRHTRGKGYSQDCEKYNAAQLLGWRVFRFTGEMIKKDPAGHLRPVIDFLHLLWSSGLTRQ